jgi:hypothetical protein
MSIHASAEQRRKRQQSSDTRVSRAATQASAEQRHTRQQSSETEIYAYTLVPSSMYRSRTRGEHVGGVGGGGLERRDRGVGEGGRGESERAASGGGHLQPRAQGSRTSEKSARMQREGVRCVGHVHRAHAIVRRVHGCSGRACAVWAVGWSPALPRPLRVRGPPSASWWGGRRAARRTWRRWSVGRDTAASTLN